MRYCACRVRIVCGGGKARIAAASTTARVLGLEPNAHRGWACHPRRLPRHHWRVPRCPGPGTTTDRHNGRLAHLRARHRRVRPPADGMTGSAPHGSVGLPCRAESGWTADRPGQMMNTIVSSIGFQSGRPGIPRAPVPADLERRAGREHQELDAVLWFPPNPTCRTVRYGSHRSDPGWRSWQPSPVAAAGLSGQ
jgi:hypothetical protein